MSLSETLNAMPVAAVVPHPAKAPRNLQIQWLRMAAALSVLLYHASIYLKTKLDDPTFLDWFDGRFGLFGVSLFFSISGYLMATAIQVQKPLAFLSHRVIRIYPLLWLVTLAHYVAIWALFDGYILEIETLLLVPFGSKGGPLGVEWSLIFEMTFYFGIFFIGLCRAVRWLNAIAFIWLAGLVVSTWVHRTSGESPNLYLFTVLSHPSCVPLAFGLLIPALLRRKLPAWPLIAVGCIAVALFPLVADDLDGSRWIFGFGTSVLLAGVLTFSARRPSFGDNRFGRALAASGDHSYALYLLHVPIVLALYKFGRALPHPLLWTIAIIVPVVAATILGSGEVALYRRLKTALNKAPPRAVGVVIYVYVAVMLCIAAKTQYLNDLDKLDQVRADTLVAQLRVAEGQGLSTEAALGKLGYAPSDRLTGNLESATWNGPTLQLQGWAVNTDKKHRSRPVIVLGRQGHVLTGASLYYRRVDVARAYHAGSHVGLQFEGEVPCTAGVPLEAFAVTDDKRYAPLINHMPVPDCH